MPRATLTLGPVLFNWSADRWRDFYFRIADEAAVDAVCVGEVVCSKRIPFFTDQLGDVIGRLERAGKHIILSSLALVTSRRERGLVDDVVQQTDHAVEINDVAALAKLRDRRFAVGPFVNVYNEDALEFLAGRGAARICLPPELPFPSIAALAAAAARLDIACEVWAFGRYPLAIAGRCYHARVHGLTKDACQFVCDRDPDGLDVRTLDNQNFLAINGVQTLSHACGNLIGEVDSLVEAGVTAFRLSPHTCDMVAVARLFHEVIERRRDAASAARDLETMVQFAPFSNGFVKGTSGCDFIA